MIEQRYSIKGLDEHSIFAISWKPDNEKIKGIVQIVHGMAEHCIRYKAFAEFLISKGYAVYTHDHRGHGKSVSGNEQRGFFDDKDGFQKVVQETHKVTEFVKKNEGDVPLVILGHSMGSFITRRYIQLYDEDISAAVISGTGDSQGAIGVLGKLIAQTISKFKGKTYQSKLLNDMSFGSYNKQFKPVRTEMDWLSRDEKQVDFYVNDEACGFICSAGFYVDLLTGIEMVSSKKNIKKTREDMPILFISGAKDPVGNNGKGVKSVYNKYYCSGLDAQIKLFEDARHEILNETIKEEVYEFILKWMEKAVRIS